MINEGKENEKTIRGMKWDVSHSLKRCVAKYETAVHQCTGRLPRLVPVDTPFLPDETKHAKCRAPATKDKYVECPTCKDTFPHDVIAKDFTYEGGKNRPLRDLIPTIDKNDCQHTDDGLSDPWKLSKIQ